VRHGWSRPPTSFCIGVHRSGRGPQGSGDAAGRSISRRCAPSLSRARAPLYRTVGTRPITIGTDGGCKNNAADKGPRGFGLANCGLRQAPIQWCNNSDFHRRPGAGVIRYSFGGAGLTIEETDDNRFRLFGTEVIPRIVGSVRMRDGSKTWPAARTELLALTRRRVRMKKTAKEISQRVADGAGAPKRLIGAPCRRTDARFGRKRAVKSNSVVVIERAGRDRRCRRSPACWRKSFM